MNYPVFKMFVLGDKIRIKIKKYCIRPTIGKLTVLTAAQGKVRYKVTTLRYGSSKIDD